jgi:hypothetical protein
MLFHALTVRLPPLQRPLDCFRQSSAPAPGLLLLVIFLAVVVIMLLNTLIAMMAETFARVMQDSFMNYAYAFAHVLVKQRCETGSSVAPLNILSLPYLICTGTYTVVNGFTQTMRAFREHQRKTADQSHEAAKLKHKGSFVTNLVYNGLQSIQDQVQDRAWVQDDRDQDVRAKVVSHSVGGFARRTVQAPL